jgi:hypothetical protein
MVFLSTLRDMAEDFAAASSTWPQCLKRQAPVLDTLLFFRPSVLDVLVFIFFQQSRGLPLDAEPWRSCKVTQRDDKWE